MVAPKGLWSLAQCPSGDSEECHAQGSVLGPELFNIPGSDTERETRHLSRFAGDMSCGAGDSWRAGMPS